MKNRMFSSVMEAQRHTPFLMTVKGWHFSVQCLCVEIKFAVLCTPWPENWSIKGWPLVVRSGKKQRGSDEGHFLLFSNTIHYETDVMHWKVGGGSLKRKMMFPYLFVYPHLSPTVVLLLQGKFSDLSVTCRADYHTAREHRQVRPTEHQESCLSTSVWISCILWAQECKLKLVFYVFLRSSLNFLPNNNACNLRRWRVALLENVVIGDDCKGQHVLSLQLWSFDEPRESGL